jgi:hypothetical protein
MLLASKVLKRRIRGARQRDSTNGQVAKNLTDALQVAHTLGRGTP